MTSQTVLPRTGRPSICIVGALIGRNPGRVTTQGEILADLFANAGIEVRSTSDVANRWMRLVDIVISLLRWHGGADVVLIECYGGPSFVVEDIASAIARMFARTVVLHLHGGAMPRFFARYPRWTRRVLARARVMVAPSSYLAAAVEPYGFTAITIPNVIDLSQYPFTLRTVVQPRLLWMRSFHPLYNPLMAVRTLASLRETHPSATLVMGGQDNGMLRDVQSQAAKLGVVDAVRFPGFLDHAGKMREGGAADVFISTNHVDNTPVAVIEAAALGLPVVCTDVGGVSHLLRDGNTGLLVPDGDAAAMAAAVRRVVDDPELARRLSTNGRAMAERSSWDHVSVEWDRLFESLAPIRRGDRG